MAKGKEAGRIQVYVRVRPFTDKEKEKKETNAIALHHDHSLIRVLDPRRETNYFFDGVFGPEASNHEVYFKVGRPLVYAALNGYKGTLLTYGQTGTGKTYTLLSEDGVTTNVVDHCFERIQDDAIHSYKITCSFLQVYQEKVYDLLNPRFTVELPVREHPKKGVYVANLTQNEVKSANDVLALLEYGKRQLVMAETKMVRHSSRSHSIMQLIIERRLKAHIAMEQASTEHLGPTSPENVHDSIMAVDETINNLLKELKQERRSHHRRERECLKELMEKELDDSHSFKGDVIVKGKINLCDLAGSERLTKTKAEGVRLTEAKYLNTSLLELGNVIHALARGKQRHVPYRNSTLTRLLQDCLGDNGKTNFIVCIAPSLSEVNETKCSLNFGLRAMRIINVARLNVEMDYKVLAERLAKKLEDQDHRHKLEKLEYLREIQRLNTAVTSYEESEHVVNSDTDTLVSVIENLSKSVQREKEAKHSLQSELTCLKRKVSNSPTATAPDIEALFLAELMSMQLLTHVYQSDAVCKAVSHSDLPSKVRDYMTSTCSQESMLLSTGYMLQLLQSCLGFGEQDDYGSKLNSKELQQSSDVSEKDDQCPTKKQSSYVQNMTGGLKKMFGLLVGNKVMVKNDDCNTKTQHSDDTTPAKNVSDTKQTMTKLVHTKEKVEKHVANLLLTAFGEQLICSQGNTPQWGVLGRKLSELIMFKRNNIIGIKDTEMWSNYENIANILESCFKYVLIDKALLASMIVIQHMDGRTLQEQKKDFQKDVSKENLKDGAKAQGVYDGQDAKTDSEAVSPSKQSKSCETIIEQEINEVFDDTSRLESELFATMEEKARLEDELLVMKDFVNKLRSNMFHLKIERANLESDLNKTAQSFGTLSDTASSSLPRKEHLVAEEYRGLRVGELSDVTEVSYESTSGGESENGSHVSENNDQGSRVLKNCLASMSQMYSLMPHPDDDTLTEGDDSEGKENASLSDDDIGDSDDDDIIITKIAREIQDFHSPSSNKHKINKEGGLNEGEKRSEENVPAMKLESTKTIQTRASVMKDALETQRSNKTLQSLQIAYEDLEDELYHVRDQLSKAQQIILNLESQLTEEKGNWEQIRKLYLENKDKNDVLEGKVAILREELEKSLRENTFLKDYHKVEVVDESQNKSYSNATKSPLKSPSRRKVFDLRSIPSIQNSNRETQIIKLLEENTELKTRNEKLSEEKMLAEHHSREKESKAKEMEERLRRIEEEKKCLQEEIETLQRRKAKLGSELLERREESLISSTELDLYSKESARLEKELAVERNMVAKLRHDNNKLTRQIEKAQADKGSVSLANDGLQMVFIDDYCSEEENEFQHLTGSHEDNDFHEEGSTLQGESNTKEALQKERDEEKWRYDCHEKQEHIKSLEFEIEQLRKQIRAGEQLKNTPSRLGEHIEDDLNTVKQENSELRQKIKNSEHKIFVYEADLEKAMLKIKQLQEYRVNSNGKSIEMNDLENSSNISSPEMKLPWAYKEIERLKEQLLDKEAEKSLLYDELHLIRLRKDELDRALDEARDARTELQEKMDEMGKCTHFEDTVKELTEKNQQLEVKLRQREEKAVSAVLEKQNEALRKLEEELVSASGEKLKSEFELRNAVIEIEKARKDLLQSKQDIKNLKVELNEKIERSANLEIQLLEVKCTNECMKSEMEQLIERTRAENHQNQEQNICRETMERRLQEMFVANNQQQSELHKVAEEKKHLSEKLCKVQEWKDAAEEETNQLQMKQQRVQMELNQALLEKKQLEGKVKKLDDTKRKMEEEFKRLRENTNTLQSDLGKMEKQQEETNKKSAFLEKDIKRKTKELEGKQREIRRLRKELSVISHAEASDDVKKRRLKEEQQPDSTKHKHDVMNTAARDEIGWDFENSTVLHVIGENQDTKQSVCQPKTKQDWSDEVGWDLTDFRLQENSSDSSENSQSQSLSIYQMQQEEEITDIKTKETVTQISKEKLLLESETARLLESRTSHLTKAQMTLEQSLSKALQENQQLLEKLNDSRLILDRIKARVSKLEEQNDNSLSRREAETQTTNFLTKETHIKNEGEHKVVNSLTGDKENEKSSEGNGSSSKAILYLTREKKQLAKELESRKQHDEDVKKELSDKENIINELKQELKTLELFHQEEKENLLEDLETIRLDYDTIKRQLKQKEDDNEKHLDAERLIIELEKDLMRQTEEKSFLKHKMSDYENKLKELEKLGKEMQSLRNEISQMSTVQEEMGQQIENYKKENQELLERLGKRKQAWNTARQRRGLVGRKSGFSVAVGRKCMKEKNTKRMKNRKQDTWSEFTSSEENEDSPEDNGNVEENTKQADSMQNKTLNENYMSGEEADTVTTGGDITITNNKPTSDDCQETDEEADIELKLTKILKDRQMMEDEMQTMLHEMNTLKARFAKRESDDQEKLQTQLEHLQSENKDTQDQVKTLKTLNTKLEVELSDALDVKLALEAEITRMTTANHTEKAENLHGNIEKLERMLETVIEENTTLYQDASRLREENQMLRNCNIREIVDGSTQVSPMTTEDEADSNDPSPAQIRTYDNKTKLCSRKGLLELPIQTGDYLAAPEGVVKPVSASSPDTHAKLDSDEGNLVAFGESNNLQSKEQRNSVKGQESEAKTLESGCSTCRKNGCQCQGNSKKTNENNTLESVASGADSSIASITDFEDISFSSDWVSAEDLRPGHSTSKGHQEISKMHREMAELKCTNTILENELTIMKNRNSDFQSQLQKLAGKNNSLKQKLSDRSLAMKKVEREMTVLTEEKMRLDVQISASREEKSRMERERGKLERSLSNSKSENKRLKNDLAMARAENYKTIKTLANLEADYKKMQTELQNKIQPSVNKSQSVDKQHSNAFGLEDGGDASYVRRASSERSLTPPSRGTNNSPQDIQTLQEKHSQRPCKSQIFPTAKGTEPVSVIQSDDSESCHSDASPRLENQMSYSSDLSFPDDRGQESSCQSDEVLGYPGGLDDKKPPQGGIKKMFKRFSKSKKTNKSFSS